MPGKKLVLDSGATECHIRKLRSRTVEIGNQYYMLCPGKIESDVPKKSVKARLDSQVLLSIFPVELWFLVAEKVEDLESFSNSSLFFRDLLLSQRVMFLFQNVWKVLETRYDTPDSRLDTLPWSWNIWEEERIPSLHRFWLTQLLTVRLVCRSWRNGVDSYYQNHPVHFKMDKEIKNGKAVSLLRSLIQEKFMNNGERSSEHFLCHFNATHSKSTSDRNPFFGRRVFLDINLGIEDPPIVAEKVVSLLSEYGHHVWYCSLYINQPYYFARENVLNSALYYRIIRRIVGLMPNLKVLQLRLPYSHLFDIPHEGEIELQNEIEINPFPKFENLELLGTFYVAPAIFNELIRSNLQISALDVRRKVHHEACNIRELPIPHLKTLSIQYYTDLDFRIWQGLRVKWPLEKLYLSFHFNEFIQWQELFDGLHTNWSETLTHLELMLPFADTDEDRESIKRQCGSYTLKLPRLTYLKLEMNTASCLDFLLPMKNSLSVLKVTVREFIRVDTPLTTPSNARLVDTWRNVERGKVIKLLSCSQRPWKSNMWTLFPRLKLVECIQEVTLVPDDILRDPRRHQKNWTLSRMEWEVKLQKKRSSKRRKK